MADNSFSIVMLAPDDWRDARRIRLEALRLEPDAFSSTYRETFAWEDDVWRRRLENP